jgi:hypothetical protein
MSVIRFVKDIELGVYTSENDMNVLPFASGKNQQGTILRESQGVVDFMFQDGSMAFISRRYFIEVTPPSQEEVQVALQSLGLSSQPGW